MSQSFKPALALKSEINESKLRESVVLRTPRAL